ncbi:gluconokinase [bacterium]|nr:gluconokinase [bacterium]
MSTITINQPELPLILSLDIGTSSVRAMLFDRLGRAVEGLAARGTYNICTTVNGMSEIDADTILRIVWRCLDDLLVQSSFRSGQIGGVATCTLVSNILGVDRAGRAITPIITYADTRPANDVATLRTMFDEVEVHNRTGCLFHTSYLPARLLWMARTQPELFDQVARWLSIGEYMELQLFGEASVSYSVASWTGLLNRRLLVWDEALIEKLPVRGDQLSPLTDVHIPRRRLRQPFAERWPPLHDVPWFPAIGDGAAANVGSGCVSPARVALTVGTTTAIRVVMPEPLENVPWGLWCYRIDRQRLLPGGALSEGGNVFAWLKSILRLPEVSKLESDLAAMQPDTHTLTVLPFLAGERSPGWAGHAKATIHGLTLANTPMDILRAGLEAVSYRVGLTFDLLKPLLPSDAEIVGSGGALLNSPVWLQIMADVLGRPVAVSQVQEASARGTALLALESLGALADVSDAPAFVGDVYQPDADRHIRYRQAIKHQEALYEKLLQQE